MEHVLDKLIRPTIKLLLFSGMEKYMDLIDTCIRTNLSREQVLETKCAFTTAALTYLLDLDDPEEMKEMKFSPTYLYRIYLIGKSEEGYSTSISHTFYLIYFGRWIILESYIGLYGFRYHMVDINQLISIMSKLENLWSPQLWEDITGIREDNKITHHVHILIKRYESDINLRNIALRYLTLISKAEDMLINLDPDDELLSLFSDNNDKYETELILKQLKTLA